MSVFVVVFVCSCIDVSCLSVYIVKNDNTVFSVLSTASKRGDQHITRNRNDIYNDLRRTCSTNNYNYHYHYHYHRLEIAPRSEGERAYKKFNGNVEIYDTCFSFADKRYRFASRNYPRRSVSRLTQNHPVGEKELLLLVAQLWKLLSRRIITRNKWCVSSMRYLHARAVYGNRIKTNEKWKYRDRKRKHDERGKKSNCCMASARLGSGNSTWLSPMFFFLSSKPLSNIKNSNITKMAQAGQGKDQIGIRYGNLKPVANWRIWIELRSGHESFCSLRAVLSQTGRKEWYNTLLYPSSKTQTQRAGLLIAWERNIHVSDFLIRNILRSIFFLFIFFVLLQKFATEWGDR